MPVWRRQAAQRLLRLRNELGFLCLGDRLAQGQARGLFMCDYFDLLWKPALVFLLLFSMLMLVARLRYEWAGGQGSLEPPRWLVLLVFWGRGFVAIAMLVLMILGFVCAGSPGDITGIIPN
jgi:hypothetical protein